MTRAHRRLIAFAFAGLLTVPAAWGRSPQRRSPSPALSPVSVLLSFLAGWGGVGLQGVWLKEGCLIEPNGRCAPDTAGGCMLGPNGACAPNPAADAGYMLDPGGRCAPNH